MCVCGGEGLKNGGGGEHGRPDARCLSLSDARLFGSSGGCPAWPESLGTGDAGTELLALSNDTTKITSDSVTY